MNYIYEKSWGVTWKHMWLYMRKVCLTEGGANAPSAPLPFSVAMNLPGNEASIQNCSRLLVTCTNDVHTFICFCLKWNYFTSVSCLHFTKLCGIHSRQMSRVILVTQADGLLGKHWTTVPPRITPWTLQ